MRQAPAAAVLAQWPCSRSSRIHLITSSVLTLNSCARRACISRTASLRRRRVTQARSASLMARLRSSVGTLARIAPSIVVDHRINAMRLLITERAPT